MREYAAKRILLMIPVIFGLSLLTFILIRIIPGDILDVMYADSELTLDELQAAWLEAPVAPDDVAGHAELVRRLRTPVAIGEHLRTVQQFKPWFERDALGIAQPDVPRTGITGAKKIAELAAAHQRQVGLHIGVFTAIGMAATWQTAAALPNFLVQEHQLDLFGPVNKILKSPLEERNGLLQVPTGPGLGVEVDEPVVLEETVEHWVIDENGKRREK